MMRNLLLLAVILALAGCGGADNPVAQNPIIDSRSNQANFTNRVLWGFWNIWIDADGNVEIIPFRAGLFHVNVMNLLEEAPCTNCLSVENIMFMSGDIIKADFRLQHPFPGLKRYTGFDVRGIFVTGTDYLFPVNGRSVTLGAARPKLLNPDGYTSLFNPMEFPEDSDLLPLFKYMTGKYSMDAGGLDATLNGYIAYGIDNPRRMFVVGSAETQAVKVYRPTMPIQFGYAVDASWVYVEKVTDPVEDFPPEANSMEAYKVVINGGSSFSLSGADPEELHVTVYDHQGLDTIAAVTVEAPDIFHGEIDFEFEGEEGPDSWGYTAILSNATGAPEGEYPMLVKVEDTGTDEQFGDVYAWGVGEIKIGNPESGWAVTWGEGSYHACTGLAGHPSGNNYAVGFMLDSTGTVGAFVIKFDRYGQFIWGRDFNSSEFVDTCGCAVFSDESVIINGFFRGENDFDPGPGQEIRCTGDSSDAYALKLDKDGNFLWVATWGPDNRAGWWESEVDVNDNVILSGSCSGYDSDLDPGPGEDIREFDGSAATLVKLTSDGDYVLGITVIGPTYRFLQAEADSEGSIYSGTSFHGSIDLDPGDGVDIHNSKGHSDAYVVKFDSEGNYLWGRSFGGEGHEIVISVSVGPDNELFAGGTFTDLVDFDPGPGEDLRSPYGGTDAFLTKYDEDGNYQWTRTFGGIASTGTAVCDTGSDVYGNAMICGYFTNTCDFDPAIEEMIKFPYGSADFYVSMFDSNGDLEWNQTGGGFGSDIANEVDTDGVNVLIAGRIETDSEMAPVGPPCMELSDMHYTDGEDAYIVKYLAGGCW